MTLGSECAVPPKPSKIKHKRMQNIPKCLPFTSLLTATLTALLHLLPTAVLAVLWIFGGLMFLREQCHFFLSLYRGANGLFWAHQDLKRRMPSVWRRALFVRVLGARQCCSLLCAAVCCVLLWYGREYVKTSVSPPWEAAAGDVACSGSQEKLIKKHQENAWIKGNKSSTAMKPMCVLLKQTGWKDSGATFLPNFSWPREGQLHSYCHSLHKAKRNLAPETPSSHIH